MNYPSKKNGFSNGTDIFLKYHKDGRIADLETIKSTFRHFDKNQYTNDNIYKAYNFIYD